MVYQNYESFRLVAVEALGGGKSNTSGPENNPEAIQDMNELVRRFSSIGGKIGG